MLEQSQVFGLINYVLFAKLPVEGIRNSKDIRITIPVDGDVQRDG